MRQLTSDPAPSRKPVFRPREAAASPSQTPTAEAPPSGSPADRGVPGHAEAKVAPAATPPLPAGLAISWVSSDKASFSPGKGESVELRYHVSRPAQVTLRLIDPQDRVVRTLRQDVASAGYQKAFWDGKDDHGQAVPPEAYTYVLSAREPSGREVSYDLRATTGGTMVWPLETALDPHSFATSYTLPQPSRVRLILSKKDTSWPIRTLLDWGPREAGRQVESWTGWDAAQRIDVRQTPGLIPILYAFSLPRNVVIVRGGDEARPAQAATPSEVLPVPALATERPLHLHAKHPRERCYDPKVLASLPELKPAAGASGLPTISGPTPLRLEIAADQGPDHERPIPRVSVFIFVDGVMVERFLVGYAPFQWLVSPERLGPGEHVITGLLSWRNDHFGIVHLKVRVDS